MFFDLNVPYSPDDPDAVHTLNFLAERKSSGHSLQDMLDLPRPHEVLT